MTTNKCDDLTAACHAAMIAATDKPGRYGGRYVARVYDRRVKRDFYYVLGDDDPKTVADKFDVLAQVTPSKVLPIGHARYYLRENGSVDLSYFESRK